MGKYIDADKLIAEIKRRKEHLEKGSGHPEVMKRVEGTISAYDSILSFVTSLQQEQPNVDLEKAAEKFAHQYDQGTCDGIAQECFISGAEWMARQGISADASVCKLVDRTWVTPINEKQFMQDVYDNFVAGSKVIVQIRKRSNEY